MRENAALNKRPRCGRKLSSRRSRHSLNDETLIFVMNLFLLLSMTTLCFSVASAFSAHLTRPWDIRRQRMQQNRNRGSIVGDEDYSVLYWSTAQRLRAHRLLLYFSRKNEILVRPAVAAAMSSSSENDKDADSGSSKHADKLSNNEKDSTTSINNATRNTSSQTALLHSDRIRDNLGPLLALTRPKNFPGVVLFHMTGVYLALRSRSTALSASYYWTILLKQPALWWTLVALLLVDSSSMVVNDYYDAKLGRDVLTHKQLTGRDRSLVSGKVSFATTKRFVSYLYAAALVLVAFLPGITTRLSVVVGLMLTYLYTQHMKPVTWLKNVVCASLIALSPWTSGSATLHVVAQTDSVSLAELAIPSLCRLVGALFAGVFSREMLMDCNDVETDAQAAVRTVPVMHGQKFASRVAFVATAVMCALTMFGPVQQLLQYYVQIKSLSTTPWALWRRFGLGAVACGSALYRGWSVVRTNGQDAAVIQRTVDEGLLAVLFLLLCFL